MKPFATSRLQAVLDRAQHILLTCFFIVSVHIDHLAVHLLQGAYALYLLGDSYLRWRAWRQKP